MTTREILQNPVSLIGSAKRITRFPRAQHGWAAVAIWPGWLLLLLLAWVGVLAWYVLLTVPLLLPWYFWAAWTLTRRHHVHDRYRAAMREQP